MAHFALVDQDNIVQNVVVVDDSQEHRGNEFLNEIGLTGNWIQTSYNNNFRGAFAQIGASYIPESDKFMPLKPEPFPSFVFDTASWRWVPPVAFPQDAAWIVGFTQEPDFIDVVVPCDTCPSGETTVKKPDLPTGSKIYAWNEEAAEWQLSTVE